MCGFGTTFFINFLSFLFTIPSHPLSALSLGATKHLAMLAAEDCPKEDGEGLGMQGSLKECS